VSFASQGMVGIRAFDYPKVSVMSLYTCELCLQSVHGGKEK